jgi:hypothetical protein
LMERLKLEHPIHKFTRDEYTDGFSFNFQRAVVDQSLMKKVMALPSLERSKIYSEATALWEKSPWAKFPTKRLIPKVYSGTLTHAFADDGSAVIETSLFENRFKRFPSTQVSVKPAHREELNLDKTIMHGLYSRLSPESLAQVRESQSEFSRQVNALHVAQKAPLTIPEVLPSSDELSTLAKKRKAQEEDVVEVPFPLVYYRNA